MKPALPLLLLVSTLVFAQAPAKDQQPKAAAPSAAKLEAKPAPGGFVGNKDSKTFHAAGCKFAVKMKPANKQAFASKAEAEKAGFKPCKACKP